MRVSEDEIGELKVVMTAVGGKSVFEAEGLF
jgi:predicted amidohydrolase YtcJ